MSTTPPLGICTTTSLAPAASTAGFDFIEEGAQPSLAGLTDDASYKELSRLTSCPLPVLAVNGLVPPTLKLVGPDRPILALTQYLTRIMARAQSAGIKVAVFGSGGARNIPDGYPPARAKDQILVFLSILAPLAQSAGITIAIEPLNRRECNILNSLAEAADYARQLNHPAIKVLVDTFHHWAENLPLKEVEDALPLLAHVHLAEHGPRTAPGTSGSNYRPLFKLLKSGYTGRLSLECVGLDLATPEGRSTATTAATYVRTEWAAA